MDTKTGYVLIGLNTKAKRTVESGVFDLLSEAVLYKKEVADPKPHIQYSEIVHHNSPRHVKRLKELEQLI